MTKEFYKSVRLSRQLRKVPVKTTVNKIVPHEDSAMEVHVEFRDDHETIGPVVNVVVFVEKGFTWSNNQWL